MVRAMSIAVTTKAVPRIASASVARALRISCLISSLKSVSDVDVSVDEDSVSTEMSLSVSA